MDVKCLDDLLHGGRHLIVKRANGVTARIDRSYLSRYVKDLQGLQPLLSNNQVVFPTDSSLSLNTEKPLPGVKPSVPSQPMSTLVTGSSTQTQQAAVANLISLINGQLSIPATVSTPQK